jgi:hypothetical protein
MGIKLTFKYTTVRYRGRNKAEDRNIEEGIQRILYPSALIVVRYTRTGM